MNRSLRRPTSQDTLNAMRSQSRQSQLPTIQRYDQAVARTAATSPASQLASYDEAVKKAYKGLRR